MSDKAAGILSALIQEDRKPTVALNMIVGPGEAFELERCLDRVKDLPFDEKVICLTSGDEDVFNLALKYGTSVVQFDWTDDFAAARNWCLDHTKSNYFMWLDADDVIPQKSMESLKILFSDVLKDKWDAVRVKYVVGKDSDGNPVSIMKERIFKRTKANRWKGAIHEAICLDGQEVLNAKSEIEGDLQILHCPIQKNSTSRNLKILEKELKREKNGRTTFYYGIELLHAERVEEGIKILEGLLDEKNAHPMYLAAACINIARYYAYDVSGTALKIKKEGISKAETYARIGLSLCKEYAELDVIMGDISQFNGQVLLAKQFYAQALTKKLGSVGYSQDEKCYKTLPADKLSLIHYGDGNFELAMHYNKVAFGSNPCERLIENRKIMLEELTRRFDKQKQEFKGVENAKESDRVLRYA